MKVSPSVMFFNHLRSKYHNFQFSIRNFQFAQQCDNLEFEKVFADLAEKAGFATFFPRFSLILGV